MSQTKNPKVIFMQGLSQLTTATLSSFSFPISSKTLQDVTTFTLSAAHLIGVWMGDWASQVWPTDSMCSFSKFASSSHLPSCASTDINCKFFFPCCNPSYRG